LDQSFDDFEYVIFDDCSKDGTYELLREISHPRLTLIRHDENIGLTKGLIHAVAQTRGQYIALHGAGDLSYSTRIEKQAAMMDGDASLGIVGCLVKDRDPGGERIHDPRGSKSLGFTHGEVMFRRSLYYKVGGYNPDFKHGQFTGLKRKMLHVAQGGCVDEVLYERLHYANGVTRNPTRMLEQRAFVDIGQALSGGSLLGVDTKRLVLTRVFTDLDLLKSAESNGVLEEVVNRHRVLKWCLQGYRRGWLSKLRASRLGLGYIQRVL
jgi:glycosyltransferase involved in cell wall biosynthesis